MSIKSYQLIFEDGTIGYMQGPEGMEQAVQIEGNPLVHKEEISADEKEIHKLINESKDKIAVKDKRGKFVIRDKKDKS